MIRKPEVCGMPIFRNSEFTGGTSPPAPLILSPIGRLQGDRCDGGLERQRNKEIERKRENEERKKRIEVKKAERVGLSCFPL